MIVRAEPHEHGCLPCQAGIDWRPDSAHLELGAEAQILIEREWLIDGGRLIGPRWLGLLELQGLRWTPLEANTSSLPVCSSE